MSGPGNSHSWRHLGRLTPGSNSLLRYSLLDIRFLSRIGCFRRVAWGPPLGRGWILRVVVVVVVIAVVIAVVVVIVVVAAVFVKSFWV
ncbi:hypothetical protein ElyMa_002925600 [Elysia marginata]|uniref:Uncharacterized protein n=1 Tax=Elysia marginata TaxID=1093978 RepID=A0AAV4I4I7_9GAST|nr:hypothetical protein ElyMa_002925600 [Elysia marginata]